MKIPSKRLAVASHPLYFVDDLANFHDSGSFSNFCSFRGPVESFAFLCRLTIHHFENLIYFEKFFAFEKLRLGGT